MDSPYSTIFNPTHYYDGQSKPGVYIYTGGKYIMYTPGKYIMYTPEQATRWWCGATPVGTVNGVVSKNER